MALQSMLNSYQEAIRMQKIVPSLLEAILMQVQMIILQLDHIIQPHRLILASQ